MMIALDVHVVDRRRGRVRLADGRSMRVVASADHHGRPCSAVVASHIVAIDDINGAYAIDVMRMTARPLVAVSG